MTSREESGGSWTLLTGHGHVLVEVARDPTARIRDIAAIVGLTRTRAGRRTHYSVNRGNLFRHSAQEGLRIGPFLDLLTAAAPYGGHDRAPAEVSD
jgi:hypothetical protein